MILTQVEQLTLKPQRIISLVPSQTSLLHYLGLDKETIGITKFCIHPTAWIKQKQIIGGTKNLRLETIRNLKPDLIIANKEENVKEQIEELAQDFEVWVTDVNTVQEALNMITDLGKLTRKENEAYALTREIEALQLQLLNGTEPVLKKSVAYFIWKDPWMVAASGTYINNLLELAGFKNYFSTLERYPTVDLKDLQNKKVDLLFLSSEPYPFKENHLKEMQPLFPEIKIELLDGEMFSWYGDHLLKSLPYLKNLKEKFFL